MAQSSPDFSKFSFVKTFVLPALLIFLIPVLAWLFFWHAQSSFDAVSRDVVLEQIRNDRELSAEERAKATAFFSEVPVSRLMLNPEFAAQVDDATRFNYTTIRWMLRLSALSVVSGIAVFVLAGICVALSLRSQFAQYISLLVGWHALRIYGALQTIVIGVLLVALSYWVPALWFGWFSVKLIIVFGILSGAGVLAVLTAIFRIAKEQVVIEGVVLRPDPSLPLWRELSAMCHKLGATPPDQIVAGIDDNFFVTEVPVTVEGKKYRGKTLFVSLALLKQLHTAEANAVLAHEMAHFSGQDTLYSKRIAPLIQRFDNYLAGLQSGGITLPVFYFMLCFRVLFELSLSKLRRQREFRADEVAASATSPRDLASALLRIAAYSTFRQTVENDLFKQERALESANVSARIEREFPEYAVGFASKLNIDTLETAHPFDSHPPLAQRLHALGVKLSATDTHALLSSTGDGGWRHNIPDADTLELTQWQAYEARFRDYHQQTLPYRFLPETDEERAIVEAVFPPQTFAGKDGQLRLDCETCQHPSWPDALHFREITDCKLNEAAVLQIQYNRGGKQSRSIKLQRFPKPQQQAFLEAFQNYYGRYLTAVEYQKQIKEATLASESEQSLL